MVLTAWGELLEGGGHLGQRGMVWEQCTLRGREGETKSLLRDGGRGKSNVAAPPPVALGPGARSRAGFSGLMPVNLAQSPVCMDRASALP